MDQFEQIVANRAGKVDFMGLKQKWQKELMV